MRNADLRARILAAMGVGTFVSVGLVACGSEPDAGTVATDAGSEASAADVRGDGDANASVDAADAASATDAPSDGSGDERLPSVRRPFLVGATLRSAIAHDRDDWLDSRMVADDPSLDDVTRAALARAWLDDGLQEHASIAAFARFSMMLLGVGAPPDLVVASQRAAIDEVAHARVCFALARRYGARQAGPGPLEVSDALGPFTLRDLAILTAEEGCVGETLGVALANAQLARTIDPTVQRVLARIVEDEARHAELAWRFVAWAIGQDPSMSDAVLAAIRSAADATLRMEIRPPQGDAIAWAAHGRLSCREAHAASAEAIRDVILPAVDALRAARASAEAFVRASNHQAHG